ncbi:MAG: hypothetical protein HY318_20140 [Armatimonadetes bacterium]|nr:hypothetical protein [Armatimonadota bacterium]
MSNSGRFVDRSPAGGEHYQSTRGLNPKATYLLKDFDKPDPVQANGGDLMETGLLVSLPQRRSSCIIQYQRLR